MLSILSIFRRVARPSCLAVFVSLFLLTDSNHRAEAGKPQLNPCWNERLAALDARLTGYSPTCAELRSTGVPSVRKVGDDVIVVVPNPSQNEYHVFAIGYATGHTGGPPEVAWQGAELATQIESACSKNGAR